MTNQEINRLVTLSVEHLRLVALAAHAEAMMDMLQVFSPGEILEIRAEAETMTADDVEAMLVDLEVGSAAA